MITNYFKFVSEAQDDSEKPFRHVRFEFFDERSEESANKAFDAIMRNLTRWNGAISVWTPITYDGRWTPYGVKRIKGNYDSK